jgi:hypothetical protein
MGIPFHIKKGLMSDRVHYRCPKCKGDLESKYDEIGSPDFCPLCGAGFTIPGQEEKQHREAEKKRKAEQTQHAKVKKAPPVVRPVATHVKSAPKPEPNREIDAVLPDPLPPVRRGTTITSALLTLFKASLLPAHRKKTIIIIASAMTMWLISFIDMKRQEQAIIVEARQLCAEAKSANARRNYTRVDELLKKATDKLANIGDEGKDVRVEIGTEQAHADAQRAENLARQREARAAAKRQADAAQRQADAKRKSDEQAEEQRRRREYEAQAAAQDVRNKHMKARIAAELDSKVSELLRSGAVHSVDVELHQARINPLVWASLEIEAKRTTVMFFSAYFEAKDRGGHVTILSSRNDQELATKGVWSGIEILQ